MAFAAAFASQSAVAADMEVGKHKAVKCMACHGLDGIAEVSSWPNIAGQKEEYLIKQLHAFRDGERQDPAMQPMVRTLTEKDIQDLAAYYSNLGPGACHR